MNAINDNLPTLSLNASMSKLTTNLSEHTTNWIVFEVYYSFLTIQITIKIYLIISPNWRAPTLLRCHSIYLTVLNMHFNDFFFSKPLNCLLLASCSSAKVPLNYWIGTNHFSHYYQLSHSSESQVTIMNSDSKAEHSMVWPRTQNLQDYYCCYFHHNCANYCPTLATWAILRVRFLH